MSNKTIIIDKNKTSLAKLSLYMQQQMPQLQLIGSFNTVSDSLALMQKEQAQLIFVNIEHLDSQTFLQLQEMRNTACSIIFLTPKLIEENLNSVANQLIAAKEKPKQSIKLKTEETTRFVHINEIVRLRSQGNYTLIYLKDETKPILTSKTLKSYAKLLNNDNQFIRPHRSHLINKEYINYITAENEKYVVLKNGTRIKASRRKAGSLNLRVPISR